MHLSRVVHTSSLTALYSHQRPDLLLRTPRLPLHLLERRNEVRVFSGKVAYLTPTLHLFWQEASCQRSFLEMQGLKGISKYTSTASDDLPNLDIPH